MSPRFLDLHRTGELTVRALEAASHLRACDLCPRRCGVNRLEGETGLCRTGALARVASWNLHFGEEEPLVGEKGSGTIFFAGCNLGCVFCQNHEISHASSPDQEVTPQILAAIMLDLQNQGAANINCVSPSHVVPQILEALDLAAAEGLDIPLVYNSGGYDSLETLRLLDGVVDIYLPDMKFFSPELAGKYCGAEDYPEVCRAALIEMHRQCGLMQCELGSDLAFMGVIVRHLVLPGDLAGSEQWMEFLAKEVSPQIYVNVMDQYRPCGQAKRFPELDRHVSPAEYARALNQARRAGLTGAQKRDVEAWLRRIVPDIEDW